MLGGHFLYYDGIVISIHNVKLVPLVKAVQEQQALIEDLRNQVKNKDAEMTELSEKYDALEGKVEQLVELLDAKL